MSILGAFTAPVVFLINFFALAAPIDLHRTLPQLGWPLELHATLALLGFGVLGIAALAGVAYLIQERQLKRHVLTSWFYALPQRRPAGARPSSASLSWASPSLPSAPFSASSSRMPGRMTGSKIVWSGVVWSLYAALVVVLALGRLSHKKTAFALRRRLCLHPAHVLGHQLPERGPRLSA